MTFDKSDADDNVRDDATMLIFIISLAFLLLLFYFVSLYRVAGVGCSECFVTYVPTSSRSASRRSCSSSTNRHGTVTQPSRFANAGIINASTSPRLQSVPDAAAVRLFGAVCTARAMANTSSATLCGSALCSGSD